jgi:hypothetical protein
MATQVTLNSGSVDSAGSLALKTNGTTTAVTIDTSQNVGIGTSSPAKQLDLAASNTGITTGDPLNTLRFTDTDTTSAAGQPMGRIEWYSADSDGAGVKAYIQAQATDGSPDGDMIFATNHVSGGGTAERMRIQYDGNVGIGTSSPAATQSGLDISSGGLSLVVGANNTSSARTDATTKIGRIASAHYTNAEEPVMLAFTENTSTTNEITFGGGSGITNAATLIAFRTAANNTTTTGTERARIDSGGSLLVGTTDSAATRLAASSGTGHVIQGDSYVVFSRQATGSAQAPVFINAAGVDSQLIGFYAQGTAEGNISVSGTTVSYNGGHLARWAQTITPKDESLVKGTVLSNLDEMNVYTDAEGNPVENEQLNKVKVSDVEGDANVAGVFVNWEHDEQHNVDEINMAMTGDMIIRIAAGTTVARGDLLMSAGDGTAKPQGDDIVRSKTIAKVTSTHVTCTYADGSFCVPCVLMAC